MKIKSINLEKLENVFLRISKKDHAYCTIICQSFSRMVKKDVIQMIWARSILEYYLSLNSVKFACIIQIPNVSYFEITLMNNFKP
ncbi:hypothetical protein QVH35_02645 [Candidatus Nitrosotenuis chungbukensis]|uniref:hypothetical protein n=1 Tax=Candidatus Nitrosotenuis chungbukensis TaxID=1353246 RepID=UPI0005B2897D|nr:hypothetical protein [Candidatus Nitrosotenuis chungbukensis]WKT58363.1 hypothetical protein QVH35_02645 [Candidatus Nitrosotenuis chungbukensis]